MTTIQKILILALFALPLLPDNYMSGLIILLSGLVVVGKILRKEKWNLAFVFFTIPFFILLISNMLHNSVNANFLSRNLIFIAIPFVFYNHSALLSPKDFQKMFWIFCVSCIVLMLYYLFLFLQNYGFSALLEEENNVLKFRTFVYDLPSSDVHPTYLSIWICTVFFQVLVYCLKKCKLVYLLLLGFFMASILLLSSKVALILLLIGIGVILLYYKKYILLGGLVLMGVFTLYQYKDSDLLKRYKELYTEYTSGEIGALETSSSTRYVVWECSTQLVKENIWWGMDSDAIYPSLEKCYKEKSTYAFYKNDRFLTHNYYYFLLLNGGILALLMFLFYYFRILKEAIDLKDLVFILFLGEIFLVNFTEDFLYRQQGIVFYNLFLMMFLFRNSPFSLLFNFFGTKNK